MCKLLNFLSYHYVEQVSGKDSSHFEAEIQANLSLLSWAPVSWLVLDLEGHHLGEQVKRHLADLGGVILVLVRHSGGDEVGVADGLHLMVARWQN